MAEMVFGQETQSWPQVGKMNERDSMQLEVSCAKETVHKRTASTKSGQVVL